MMNNGETLYIRLVYAANTDIRRFKKITAEANPFDVEWKQYFEEREGEKMLNSIRGRGILTKLWKQQGKLCPVCGEKITLETGFKVHDTDKTSKNDWWEYD
jgi:RNA-directed DNA polymerase